MKEFSTYKKNEKCKNFHKCSGCEFEKENFSEKNWKNIRSFFKEKSNTQKNPKLIIGDIYNYRCKAKLAVRKNKNFIDIGLFKKNTHKVIDIENCYLHHHSINKAVLIIRKWMKEEKILPYDESSHMGDVRYIQLFVDKKTKKIQLVLVVNHKYEKNIVKIFLPKLKRLFIKNNLWHSIWLNFQIEQTNRIFGDFWHLCFGEKLLWQNICKQNIAFHPACFSQAHIVLFEKMIEDIFEKIPENSKLLELYAGVGAIGLNLLNKCKKIDFVEENDFAKNAFDETVLNIKNSPKMTYHNVSVKDAVFLLDDSNVIIVDPPRKGMDKLLLENLFKQQNKKLIYISCNFDSFQKDCSDLIKNGWELKSLDGYLLFPKSSYIEILAVLEKESE